MISWLAENNEHQREMGLIITRICPEKTINTSTTFLYLCLLFTLTSYLYVNRLYTNTLLIRRCCYMEEEGTQRFSPTSFPGTCSLRKLPFSPEA